MTTIANSMDILFAEEIKIAQQFTNTNAIACGLAGVGWTNTLFGGTQRFATLFSFLHTINSLMEIENQMCTIGYN